MNIEAKNVSALIKYVNTKTQPPRLLDFSFFFFFRIHSTTTKNIFLGSWKYLHTVGERRRSRSDLNERLAWCEVETQLSGEKNLVG